MKGGCGGAETSRDYPGEYDDPENFGEASRGRDLGGGAQSSKQNGEGIRASQEVEGKEKDQGQHYENVRNNVRGKADVPVQGGGSGLTATTARLCTRRSLPLIRAHILPAIRCWLRGRRVAGCKRFGEEPAHSKDKQQSHKDPEVDAGSSDCDPEMNLDIVCDYSGQGGDQEELAGAMGFLA